MKAYELGDLDEILRSADDKGTILVTRDGVLVGDCSEGLAYVKTHPNVAYHVGCIPVIILGGYTVCFRVGGVLLTKKVRDALKTRPGTLEMRLALTPQVISPDILFEMDWPFKGAQAMAYFFARLLPFAIVLFCILVFVFRNTILESVQSFVKR